MTVDFNLKRNMESLFAYSYLLAWGFCSLQEYNAYLDKMFLETPDNEVLLDLEECSNSYKDTFARLKRYFEYETDNFDKEQFGKTLLNGLESVYHSNVYSIAAFTRKCYELYTMLPECLKYENPFWFLDYADEPLSWGDEKYSRVLCEKAFGFYRE